MNKSLLLTPVAILTMANLSATLIDLGPSGIITERSRSFSGLEGMQLAGQSLNLDFSFSNNEFIRVYSTTEGRPAFYSSLFLQTSATTSPGFLVGNGYVTDANGQQYSGLVGRAMGDDGTTYLGLFPFWNDIGPIPGIATPLDIYGIHYDITLPTTAQTEIVSSQLGIFGLEISNREGGPFSTIGIGPGIPDQIPPVPDAGSTLLLLAIPLILLFFYDSCICRNP
jgi:hypothetical protein